LERIIREAAEGLSYLHKQGWIHRDVKPDNFLVDPDGHIRLIDFNLAQRRKGALARMLGGKSKIQGTMSYMSPEQIRGQAIDERTDIYSFGCMLYELAGGRFPFTGVSSNELLNKHLKSKAPPVTAANNNLTTPFADLLAWMIEKKPQDRPDTMDDVLISLRAMRIFRRQPIPPPVDVSSEIEN
jgi:serine/threonine protein kinase